jgi:hypothetical protein
MAKVTLYEDIEYGGDKLVLTKSDPNLDDRPLWFDFNDELSSFKVESGHVRFYSSSNYGGVESRVFNAGEKINWVENVGITNDSVSSVSLWG